MMNMRRISTTLVSALSLLSLAGVTAQQAPVRDAARKAPVVGTAVVSGTVVTNEPNGRPLRRVTVQLNATATGPSSPRMTTTDDQGRFIFTMLPAGNYSALRATKPGYVATTFGEKRVGGIGIPITIAEGQRMNVALKMLKGGVITGTIVDDAGNPSQFVQVQASPIRMVNGVRQATMGGGGYGSTDDRGIYRMFGLAPGDYVVVASPRFVTAGEVRSVSAEEIQWAQQQLGPRGIGAGTAQAPGNQVASTPRPSPAVAYSPVYYPGTVDAAGAAAVTVLAGQELTGIDFHTQFVPTSKVEGTILYPDGQPAPSAQVNIIPKVDSSLTMMGIGSSLMFDTVFTNRPQVIGGKFTIAALKPGEYTISARAVPRDAPAPMAAAPAGGRGMPPPMSLWAMADITVSGADQSGLVVRLEPGMTLTGKIAFEGTVLQPPPDLSRVNLRLTGAPNPSGVSVSVNPGVAQVSADGSFTFAGVTPGRYLLNANAPAAAPVAGTTWQVRSAMLGGIDAADNVFEVKPGQNVEGALVTFTDKAAEVSGTLADATGAPTSDFSVILFSVNKTSWTQRSRRFRPPARAGLDGKFKFVNLPAGEYYLAALTDFEPSDINNPAFLDQVVPSAIRITLTEGEKKTQDIRLAGGSD
jgi:hypothetical protein